MADEATASDETPVTFHVKSSGNAKYTLTLPLSTTAIDLKNKLATAEYANIPAESQRLIYSGRVLKDPDTLASYKVKEGNTMHLVKSAPSNQRQNPASSVNAAASQSPASTTGPVPSGVPSNLATGPGNNPLAGLTGARYAGFAQLPGAGMFGPDGGMGPPPGPDQMIEMMSNPQFAQMMNEALQNPQMIDMMIQQNPQLRAMGPQARQMLQSDQFRRMVTDPEALRSMAQLQRAMGMGGAFGGAGQDQAFPAPGVTNTTAPENQNQGNTGQSGNESTTNANSQQNPFAMFGPGSGLGGNPFAHLFNPGTAQSEQTPATQGNPSSPGAGNTGNDNQPPGNPFAALFNPALFGQPPQQGQSPGTGSPPPQQPAANPFLPQNNPFANNPDMLNNLMRAMGGNGAGGGGADPWRDLFGGMGGMGNPPAPADNRPPEERFAEQLRQLNDMGFFDFDRNIQALTRSGGSVQGAIEHLLGGS